MQIGNSFGTGGVVTHLHSTGSQGPPSARAAKWDGPAGASRSNTDQLPYLMRVPVPKMRWRLSIRA